MGADTTGAEIRQGVGTKRYPTIRFCGQQFLRPKSLFPKLPAIAEVATTSVNSMVTTFRQFFIAVSPFML